MTSENTSLRESVQQELQVAHYFSGGTYAKRMIIKAGASINSHKHQFDHMSILAQGTAIVSVNGIANIHQAPTVIEIKREQIHKVTALTDCHWYCIHATDITDPELIDESLISEADHAI